MYLFQLNRQDIRTVMTSSSNDVISIFINQGARGDYNKLFQNPETLVNEMSENHFHDLLNLATKESFIHLETTFIPT